MGTVGPRGRLVDILKGAFLMLGFNVSRRVAGGSKISLREQLFVPRR